MLLSSRTLSTLALAVAFAFVTTAARAVVIVSGEVDIFANASSGKAGSSSGVISESPDPLAGTSGTIAQIGNVTAGPVAPGALPTLPGTDGVVQANASSSLQFVGPAANVHKIVTAVSVGNNFSSMDGGIYAGNAQAIYSTEFSVAVATPYTITGNYVVDDENLGWKLQLSGPGGFLLNDITAPLDADVISESGTLQPNTTYTLSAQVAVSETISGSGSFSESGFINATAFIPTPSTALCGAAMTGLMLVRRRRASGV
jgi:hypothetical protein